MDTSSPRIILRVFTKTQCLTLHESLGTENPLVLSVAGVHAR